MSKGQQVKPRCQRHVHSLSSAIGASFRKQVMQLLELLLPAVGACLCSGWMGSICRSCICAAAERSHDKHDVIGICSCKA